MQACRRCRGAGARAQPAERKPMLADGRSSAGDVALESCALDGGQRVLCCRSGGGEQACPDLSWFRCVCPQTERIWDRVLPSRACAQCVRVDNEMHAMTCRCAGRLCRVDNGDAFCLHGLVHAGFVLSGVLSLRRCASTRCSDQGRARLRICGSHEHQSFKKLCRSVSAIQIGVHSVHSRLPITFFPTRNLCSDGGGISPAVHWSGVCDGIRRRCHVARSFINIFFLLAIFSYWEVISPALHWSGVCDGCRRRCHVARLG